MKNIIKFTLFILYTIFLFFIEDIKFLIATILLNFIITIILKVNVKKMYDSIKILLPFVVITMLFNIFLASVQEGILIGVRILICYHATYLFSQTMTTLQRTSS